jgi:FMN phosphatase YigB (HAD superfamily)
VARPRVREGIGPTGAEREIDVVFFDVGGTLGDLDPETGQFAQYASRGGLLRTVRDVISLRVGVVTTLGTAMTNDDAREMLREAGLDLDGLLDPRGFVSDRDAGAAKPDVAIDQFAAARVGVPIGRRLFVGEYPSEIIGALAEGMKSVLKPCPRAGNGRADRLPKA